MAFRESFDCLWCGRPWQVRGPTDLEGWAQLCPDCLGRAGENAFLRDRLRSALAERAGTQPSSRPPAPAGDRGTGAPPRPSVGARAADDDDWYLRRGVHEHGPIHDAAWQAELDAAGRWLDALPIRGEIVELAAGTGWWSPLLAEKGELSIYDADEAPLERARERLVAHGQRAHIHVRDAWSQPDRRVDAVFAGFWLSHVPRGRLDDFLRLVHRWLKPGGTFAAIDVRPDPQAGAADAPTVNVHYAADELRAALLRAGFAGADVTTTGRFFALASAVA